MANDPHFSPKVILITGSSSGLGLALTRAALAHGHKVIATSRDPSKTPSLVAEVTSNGGHWLPLDVAAPDLGPAFAAVLAAHGRVDVVINNAGVGVAGAFEDEDPAHVRAVFETNFFGVLALTRLVLPVMRRQDGGGVVVNVSSAVVTMNHPGLSLYSASKWALEGWSEVLRREVAELGIRVVLAVPGDMRTSFTSAERQATAIVQPSEAYRDSAVGFVLNMLRENDGKQGIDPVRAAERILEVVEGKEDVKFRLPIGTQPVEGMTAWAKGLVEEVQAVERIARSCDFPEHELRTSE